MNWGFIATIVSIVGGVAWLAATYPKAYRDIVWPVVKWLYLIAGAVGAFFLGAFAAVLDLQAILSASQQADARAVLGGYWDAMTPVAVVWLVLVNSLVLMAFLASAVEKSGDKTSVYGRGEDR